MAIRFAKVDADLDSHPKVRRAGRAAREVFLFVLRRNASLDLSGRVPVSYTDPVYLAEVLMMPEVEASHAMSRCVTVGLLRVESGFVSISGWDDGWAKAPLTAAERQRRKREKGQNSKRVRKASRNVTDGIVTDSDSHACHASEESRVEEKREQRESGKPDVPPPVPAHVALAEVAVAEINRLGNRRYRADSDSVVTLCKALAKAKRTPEQIKLVIASKAVEWIGDPKMGPRFCPGTLLAAANFAKYLDDIEAGAPTRGAAEPGLIQTRVMTNDDMPPLGEPW